MTLARPSSSAASGATRAWSSRSRAASTRRSWPRSRRARSATRALAVTAVSPAVAAGELDGARRVAARRRHRPRDGRDRRARPRRLPRATAPTAATSASPSSTTCSPSSPPAAAIACCSRAPTPTTPGDWRPGLRAAAEHGVRHPLLDAGAGKADVRALARAARRAERGQAGHAVPRVAASPTAPPSTPRRSRRIDRAERAVRALGFPVLRVRHHGILGRLEVAAEDLDRALEREPEIVARDPRGGLRPRGHRPRAVPLGPPQRGAATPRVVSPP